MHDRGVVIGHVEVVCFQLLEVSLQSSLNVLEVDCDVNVPVTSALLVKEAEHVNQLVLDDAISNASIPQRNFLIPPSLTNQRPASRLFHNADVVRLIFVGHETDAGAQVEAVDSAADRRLVGAAEGIAHCVRDLNQRAGLWPPAVITDSSIPCLWDDDISFNEVVLHWAVCGEDL